MQINSRAKERIVAQAGRVLAFSILTYISAAAFSAPNWAQDGCSWFGTRPFCDGQCPAGTVYTGQRESCTTGSRRYCCPSRMVTSGVNCHWVGHPGSMLWVCDAPPPKPPPPPSPPWVAVAINNDGGWGASIQSEGSTVAVPDALHRCGNNCRIAAQGPGRCVAVVTSKTGGNWFGYAFGDDVNAIRSIAMKGCTDRAPSGCRVVHENCLAR
jgi:hypothetical protein